LNDDVKNLDHIYRTDESKLVESTRRWIFQLSRKLKNSHKKPDGEKDTEDLFHLSGSPRKGSLFKKIKLFLWSQVNRKVN